MNKRDIIHLIIGKDEDIGPKTKTGCNKLLENCGSGVTYRHRAGVTCPVCANKVAKIEHLRGD